MASTDGVGTKIKVAIARGRPRHRGLRPRGPLRERHPGAGCRAPLLPRLHRPRPDGLREGGGHRARLRPRLRRVRLSAHRRRDRGDAGHLRAPTTTTSPASSWGSWTGRRRCPAGSREGDVLLGLPSAGLHTNGYSLARKVALRATAATAWTPHVPELGTTVGRGAARSAPQLPRRPRAAPRARQDHGALPTSRAAASPATSRASCPPGLGAAVRRGSWEVPPLFRLIQRGGAVADDEMFRTFNMGDRAWWWWSRPEDLHEVEHSLERRGETSFVIGSVVRGRGRRLRVTQRRVHEAGRRPRQRPRHRNLQALLDAAQRGAARGARSRSWSRTSRRRRPWSARAGPGARALPRPSRPAARGLRRGARSPCSGARRRPRLPGRLTCACSRPPSCAPFRAAS